MPKSFTCAAAAALTLVITAAASASPGASEAPPPEVPHDAVVVSPDVLAGYVGRYELAPGTVAVITLEDGRLYGAMAGGPQVRLFALAPNRFSGKTARGEDAQVSFEAGPDGHPVGMNLQLNGTEFTATRVADSGGGAAAGQ